MSLVLADKNIKKFGRKSERYSGWKQTGLKAGELKGVMSDEDYHYILGYHKPAWDHILDVLPKEGTHPIVVIGKNSIPIAIELSQWDYPVTILVKDYDDEAFMLRTQEIHAGELKIVEQDYLKNIPRCHAVFISDLLEYFTDEQELKEFLSMLLDRSQILFITTTLLKNWYSVLDNCYDIRVQKYRSNYLLVIKNL